MARLFELRATSTDVVLRAMAIAAVVVNHTSPFDHGGGAAFLLMLSGLNFARFAIKDADASGIRRSIVQLALGVFVPSLVLVLLSFAFYGKFDVFALLFVRNWLSPHKTAAFPVWYSQMLLQILAGLYVVSWIPMVVRATVRRPALAMLILLAAALLFRACEPFLSNPYLMRPRLPMTHLWTFALGAVVYFLAVDTTSSRSGRWIAAACVVASALVGHEPSTLRFWWLAGGGLLLVGVTYIRLPSIVAQVTTVVSAAAFGIFLTHQIWMGVVSRVNEVWAGPDAIVHPLILVFFAIVLGTLTWGAVTAFGRACRAIQPEAARPTIAAGIGTGFSGPGWRRAPKPRILTSSGAAAGSS